MHDELLPPKASGPVTVVVADDAPAVIAELCRFFGDRPNMIIVGTAADGREAVLQAKAHRPHLVVLDVHMPGMDGLEAAREIRESLPDTRIIMISIDQDLQRRADCLDAGADSFVPKIGMRRKLVEEIARLFPHLPQWDPS